MDAARRACPQRTVSLETEIGERLFSEPGQIGMYRALATHESSYEWAEITMKTVERK